MDKTILDCDPGTDDALAILFAMALDEVDILAITTVSGNRPVDRTFENARNLAALGGRSDIPVFRGAVSPRDRTEPRSNLAHTGVECAGLLALMLDRLRLLSSRVTR